MILLSPYDLAKELKVSRELIQYWLGRDKLPITIKPFRTPTGKWLFDEAMVVAIKEWKQAQPRNKGGRKSRQIPA